MNLRATVLGAVSLAPVATNPLWRAYYRLRRFDTRKVYDLSGSRAEVFAEIYRRNLWWSSESRSGGGSTLGNTRYVRKALPRLLRSLGAKSLLDAPCGDFNWMRAVSLDGIDYTGADIVPDMIGELATKFSARSRRFVVADIVTDKLPRADVWMCRDVLMHLPLRDVTAVLRNFLASGCAYFLATSYDLTAENSDLPVAGFRPLNLRAAPFGLPAPISRFDDFVAPMEPRIMGLWSRAQVAEAFRQAPMQ